MSRPTPTPTPTPAPVTQEGPAPGLDTLRSAMPPKGMHADVARRADLSRAYLCDVLAGRRPLTLELAYRLARALGIAPSTLDSRLTDRID
jgi:transcriptional regulator with XRE-family HTH domain